MAFIIVSDFSGTLSAILNLRAIPFPLPESATKKAILPWRGRSIDQVFPAG